METYLRLSIGGLPPFSSRGCRQTLAPIQTAQLNRTVNGELVTTSSPVHQKYKTTIKSQDRLPAALDNLWKGQDVEVSCIQMLWQKADKDTVTLSRDPVANSLVAVDEKRRPIGVKSRDKRQVELDRPGYVGYRPILKMKIVDFGYDTEEWGEAAISWFLHLEEV